MLVNSAFFLLFFVENQSITTVFPSLPACLSVDLDKSICRMSLDSTVFFSFFSHFLSIREKLYSRNFLHFGDSQKFIHAKFSKACHSRK